MRWHPYFSRLGGSGRSARNLKHGACYPNPIAPSHARPIVDISKASPVAWKLEKRKTSKDFARLVIDGRTPEERTTLAVKRACLLSNDISNEIRNITDILHKINTGTYDRGSHENGEGPEDSPQTEVVARKVLAEWMDLHDNAKRTEYWREMKSIATPSSLTYILLYHLNLPRNINARNLSRDAKFEHAALETLAVQGFSMKDVETWAWVIRDESAETKAERFLSIASDRPAFLLIEILRRDLYRVETLKRLLMYMWDIIRGNFREPVEAMSDVEMDAAIQDLEIDKVQSRLTPAHKTAFVAIFKRFLYQVRRIWPPAMVTIAQMASPFLRSTLDNDSGILPETDSSQHAHLCKQCNIMIRLLERPSAINPFKSMAYNWEAQKILLKMANDFDPPLLLNQGAYRAIARVLLASKKSDRESKAAQLRDRSWPPWRIEQDGMDAQRRPEEDLSRVVSVLIQAQEAGYRLSVQDIAMQILGGQEVDGTPTIHTRTIQTPTSQVYSENIESETEIWAARIQATRDIEEAWSAFDSFRETGRQPSKSMYFSMLEKCVYEQILYNRRVKRHGVPGDGKELFAPSNDNYSTAYKLKRRPPPFESLYNDMLQANIRPSGRFLDMIVAKARTIEDGICYLRDGNQLSSEAFEFLMSPGERKPPPGILKGLRPQTIASLLILLGRFTPRLVPRIGDYAANLESVPNSEQQTVETQTKFAGNVAQTDSKKMEWGIIRLRPPELVAEKYPNPLVLATQLLSNSRPLFRPAWYAIFQVLARRGSLLDRSTSKLHNDIISWLAMRTLLNDFSNNRWGKVRFELDPDGFKHICRCAEKAVLAFLDPSIVDDEAALMAQVEGRALPDVLKQEFRKLTMSNDDSYLIPRLNHSILGIHLQAYIRVMGFLEDYEEILCVLNWMVEHHVVLDEVATKSANGHSSLRNTFIAIKSFIKDEEYATKAKELIESVELWKEIWGRSNGEVWPTDEEVREYITIGEKTLYKDTRHFDPRDYYKG